MASASRIRVHTHLDVIDIARRAKRDPGSLTLHGLRALALFVMELEE